MTDHLASWAARRKTHLRPRQLPSGEWVLVDTGFIASDHDDPEAALQAIANRINQKVESIKLEVGPASYYQRGQRD